MKTYQVHFSYYSEEYGNFDESFYKVDADDPFEARRVAWAIRDTDDEAKFQSCVQLCGVTWDAAPLDLADYFRAQAAYDKYMIRRVVNVDAVNAALTQNLDAGRRAESDRGLYFGSLGSVSQIARDLGKPFGMEPPEVYEEIEYAWRLVGKFDETGLHEQAQVLADRIDKAKKWDQGAIHGLRELFEHESIHLPGEYVNMRQFFGKDGIYPKWEDINEHEYTYINRWKSARSVDTLARLPMFGEKDVIKNSGSENTPFDYKTLVLKQSELREEYHKPENILWTPHYDAYSGECINLANRHPDTRFNVENMITGHVVGLRFKDFSGVLRPEYADNINFDALKKEYAAQNATENEAENGILESPEADGEEEWEMGDE